MQTKNKILFLLKMPPPFTGATYMNSIVYESTLISDAFDVKKIAISYANNVKELGKFRLKKFVVFANTFLRLLSSVSIKKPAFIYFQPSILGTTYLRDLILILTGKFFRVKFLLHLHGKGIAQAAERSKLVSYLYRLGIANQYVIVLSDHQKADVAFLKPLKIFVVNNGIAPILSGNTGHKKEYSRPFKFLFLSNLLKSKGLFDLLETAKELKKKGYVFMVDIVGNEGDVSKEELMMQIEREGLSEYVFYHGPQYGEHKIKYFEEADAFVFPTQNDAFGLVLLEAMQFSIPVIATNEGAIPEIVEHGQSGFIYNKNKKECLGDFMSELMNNPEQAIQHGKRGREIYLEKFTLDVFENNMLSVFNETINNLKK